MRYYLSHKGHKKISKRLKILINKEKLGLDNYKKLKQFEKNCQNSKKINQIN